MIRLWQWLRRRPSDVMGVAFASVTAWCIWWLMPAMPRVTLGGPDKLNLAALSPNGRFVATAILRREGNFEVLAETTGPIQVWDATTGTLVASFASEDARNPFLDFSPDGELLVELSRSQVPDTVELTIYDVAKWADLAKFKSTAYETAWFEKADGRSPFRFSSDSKTLTFWGPNHEAVLWDATAKRVRTRFEAAMALPIISSNGGIIVTNSVDGSHDNPECLVTVWDAINHCEVNNIALGADRVYAIELSDDGRMLVAAKEKKVTGVPGVTGIEVIELWETATGRRLAAIDGDTTLRSISLAFEGRGRLLQTRYSSGAGRIWDIQSSPPRPISPGFIDDAAFSPDGTLMAFSNACEISGVHYRDLFSAGTGRTEPPPLTVTIWDIVQGGPRRQFAPSFPRGVARVLGFAQGGPLLAVQGSWMKNRAGAVRTVRRILHGRLTRYFDEGEVQFFDTATGCHRGTLEGVSLAILSPDGRTIAERTDDHRILLYDIPPHKPWRLVLLIWLAAFLAWRFGWRRRWAKKTKPTEN